MTSVPSSRTADFRVIASDLAFPEGPVALPDGSVLVVEIAAGRLSRVDMGGRVVPLARLGGSPNGAAIGPDGKCYVCNSGGFKWAHHPGYGMMVAGQPADYSGGRIERVDLQTNTVEVLYTGSGVGPLRGPNDLVFDAHGGFWFTDSGKVRDHDRDHGAIYYARADRSLIRRVVYPVIHPHPNGIGLSPDGSVLYMAETVTGRLWAFDIKAPGEIDPQPFPSPHGGRLVGSLPGYQMFDSLAVEANGNICVATLINGGIAVFTPDGSFVEHVSIPDLLVTNLCFGGPDRRVAFITASAQGRLIAMDWDRPGLRLNAWGHSRAAALRRIG